MEDSLMRRFCCFCTSAVFLAASGILPVPVAAAATPSLSISQVSVTEDAIAQGSAVAVDVLLNDNTEGFLAASFGIAFDTALTFDHVDFGNDAGSCFEYACNQELGALWFSGASGSAEDSATAEETTLFTLYFIVPEDTSPGDVYDIQFLWDGLDGNSGFWCVGNHTNIIGNIQSVSHNGGISVLDPTAPCLDQTDISIHVGGTKQLSVLNYSAQPTWVSDDAAIASVSADGTVTGVAEGSCKIYAFLDNAYLICSVTVTEDAYYDVSTTSIVYIIDPDQQVYLQVPDTGALLTPTWFCDNTAVVTVDNGKLQAIQNGSATVYAICGNQVYTTQVVVDFEEDLLSGDVNLDGNVTITDVIKLSKALQGADYLTTDSTVTADAFYDELINTMDALTIMKFLVHIETALPVQNS